MRLYFYTNEIINNQEAKAIMGYLKRAEINIFSNLSLKAEAKGFSQDQPLDKMDALIFQGKKLDAKSSYLVALVLSQGKEVLCLIPQGTKLDDAWQILKSDSNLSAKLHLEFYSQDNLEDKVFDFLKSLDSGSIKDLFNIKYTLRVSGKLADYLNWKAKKLNTKKADWLRDQIQAMMADDADYQKFLKNKFVSKN